MNLFNIVRLNVFTSLFGLLFVFQGVSCEFCCGNNIGQIPVKSIKVENIDFQLATVFFAYNRFRNEIVYLANRNDSTIKIYDLSTQKVTHRIIMPKGYRNEKFNLYTRHDSVFLGIFYTGSQVSKSFIKEMCITDTGLLLKDQYEIQNFFDYPIVDYLNKGVAFDLINGITTNLVTGKYWDNKIFNSNNNFEINESEEISIYRRDKKVIIRNYNIDHIFSEYAYVRIIENDSKTYLIIWEKGKIQIREYANFKNNNIELLREVLIDGEDEDMIYLTLYCNGVVWLNNKGLNVVDLGLKL